MIWEVSRSCKILEIDNNMQCVQIEDDLYLFLGNNKSQSLSSLYDLVTKTDETFLNCSSLTYDNINKTMIGNTGVGLFVTDDISFQLKTGDRFLTINDKNIFNINQDEWNTIKISVAFPVEAVVIRQRNKFSQSGPGSGPGWCW